MFTSQQEKLSTVNEEQLYSTLLRPFFPKASSRCRSVPTREFDQMAPFQTPAVFVWGLWHLCQQRSHGKTAEGLKLKVNSRQLGGKRHKSSLVLRWTLHEPTSPSARRERFCTKVLKLTLSQDFVDGTFSQSAPQFFFLKVSTSKWALSDSCLKYF